MSKPPVELRCENCGGTFLVYPYRQATARYCSTPCMGVAYSERHVGPKHPHWKGGRVLTKLGYVRVRVNGRYEYEHRVVAAARLGRRLERHEHVHHVNGDRADNRPENLEVVDGREHNRMHTDRRWTDNPQRFRAAGALCGAPRLDRRYHGAPCRRPLPCGWHGR